MSDYIHTIEHNKDVEPGKDAYDSAGYVVKTTGYTIAPNVQKHPDKMNRAFYKPQEIGINDPKCYAKQATLQTNGNIAFRYYAKVGIDGFLFDPWGPFSEGMETKFARHKGVPQWSFKQISELCFEYYRNYLSTRNQTWLRHAEREK